MTYNLKDFRFTLLSDTVIKLEDIVVNTSVDTLTGSDVVSGTLSPTGTGLKIESTGSLTTGFGGDRLLGVSSGLGALQPGPGISNAGVVQMGFDNDIIRGVVTGESGGGGRQVSTRVFSASLKVVLIWVMETMSSLGTPAAMAMASSMKQMRQS